MIGIKKNREGVRVLTTTDRLDVDDTVDIIPSMFACVFITADSLEGINNALTSVNPISSYKCSYKPLFVKKAFEGRLDYDKASLVDGYINDTQDPIVASMTETVKANMQKYGIKHETERIANSTELFIRVCRYYLSRGTTEIKHVLSERSSLGYVNPIMEFFHSIKGTFRLREMFSFQQTMLEYGYFKESRYIIRSHICPNCQHSHLLYTECCPKCGNSDLMMDDVIHHFRCANVSPESTYNRGGQLICPKCHIALRHIGIDYDRPASVFTCKSCSNTFVTPIMKSTCSNCGKESDVRQLLPHDVIDYDITQDGINALCRNSMNMPLFANLFDNYIEYSHFLNRIRIQLSHTYDESVKYYLGVAKIWIFDSAHNTERMPDALQGELCRFFANNRVSYANNIFYVARTSMDDSTKDDMLFTFRANLTNCIRRMAKYIEPGHSLCYNCDAVGTGDETEMVRFIKQLDYINGAPDDMCSYEDRDDSGILDSNVAVWEKLNVNLSELPSTEKVEEEFEETPVEKLRHSTRQAIVVILIGIIIAIIAWWLWNLS